MFNRFIVATDLSPASFAIVNCLGGLSVYGAKQCLLLQCLNLQESFWEASATTWRAMPIRR